jgi:hypothetical protein
MESQKNVAVGNTVRAPGAPFARPRTASSRNVSIKRGSNSLRASVLDVAMQIGLGTNGAVTDWVYKNSVHEDEEVRQSLAKSSSALPAFAWVQWASTECHTFYLDRTSPQSYGIFDHGVMVKTFNYRT